MNIVGCQKKDVNNNEKENGKAIKIGGENFAVIAGPCAVENEDQIIKVAKCIKDAGGFN